MKSSFKTEPGKLDKAPSRAFSKLSKMNISSEHVGIGQICIFLMKRH